MKIQAGHYYRTRDGRKVGPMQRNGQSSHFTAVLPPGPSGCARLASWLGSGVHLSGNESEYLVAEWQDEPADLVSGPESKWTDTEVALHAALQNCLAREPVNPVPQFGNAVDTSKWTKQDWERAVAEQFEGRKPESEPPAEPDWLPWSGGECPVHPEAYVEFCFASGKKTSLRRRIAGHVDWRRSTNIKAYRVLWTLQEEKPKRKGETLLAVMLNDAGAITYRTGEIASHLRAYAHGSGIKVVAIIDAHWTEGDGL